MVSKSFIFFSWSLQEEDELVVASCVLRSFDEDAYDSPDEEEEWNDFLLKTNLNRWNYNSTKETLENYLQTRKKNSKIELTAFVPLDQRLVENDR